MARAAAPAFAPASLRRLAAGLGLVVAMAACGSGSWRAPTAESHPPQLAYDQPPLPAPPPAAQPTPGPAAAPSVTVSAAGARRRLELDSDTMTLDAGRWVVEVAVPARHYVTIGVSGPRDALRGFEVIGRKGLRPLRSGTLDDDGMLPSFVSFDSHDGVAEVAAVIDVDARVTLSRHAAPRVTHDSLAVELAPGSKLRRHPLVGLPFGLERRAGYRLQVPPRYAFVRADVAAALRSALRQTRIRYRRNRIAVGDCSQWNGQRPAMDLGKPRHISHEGGRDVDIALPTRKSDRSTIERRCEGVMVEEGRLECGPGTVRHFDAARTAYLLSLLIDGPTPGGRYIGDAKRRPGPLAVVETIFTDQAYIDEIRRVLPKLRQRKWIHDEAYGALGEEGLLRPSPWHTDHMHIRFAGAPATLPAVLKGVSASPPPVPADKIRVPTSGPN